MSDSSLQQTMGKRSLAEMKEAEQESSAAATTATDPMVRLPYAPSVSRYKCSNLTIILLAFIDITGN